MTVYLVGAGPGDPDLLTVKARRVLRNADVLVYDRLVSPEVLDLAPPWAEQVPVGKDPYGSSTTQEEINRLLTDRGRRFDTVVRLKGGDPFVFGRGGEEALELAGAGVAVDVIPGITSAIAGPAAAGIPVTHRALSSAFTVVTAHQDPNTETTLDWSALARLGSTLVVLMGAMRASALAARLLSEGMSPQTPVAVITSATTPNQEIVRLRLECLGLDPIPNPAVIVIGEVAGWSMLTGHTSLETCRDKLASEAPLVQPLP